MSSLGQPLEGLRVLELPSTVAGSYCTKLLADFGAEVIKVEHPGSGDPARQTPPFVSDGSSALFLHLNTNKYSVTLDTETPTGLGLLRRLIATSDVMVECFRKGTLDKWNLGFDACLALNPSLVLLSLTAFGQTGPYSSYVGEDIVAFAMGGMASQGVLGRPPLKMVGYHAQYHAGAIAATAVLGAHLVSQTTDEGIHIDLSTVEAQNGAIDGRRPGLVSFQYTRDVWHRQVKAPVSTIPSSIYPAGDGYVQIMTIPAHVGRMLATLNSDVLNATFAAPGGPPPDSSTKDMVDAVLMPWLLERTRDEAMRDAQAHGWAVTSFNEPSDVVVDPQVVDRGFMVDVDLPTGRTVKQPGAPFRMESGWALKRPAPALGQDNDKILSELGLDDGVLKDLPRAEAVEA